MNHEGCLDCQELCEGESCLCEHHDLILPENDDFEPEGVLNDDSF